MKSMLLSALASIIFFSSVAQNTERIQRAYAFFKVIQPGNIPMDDNGRRIQTAPNIERFIYIECSGSKMPTVTDIRYNNIPLGPTVTGENEITVHAGKKFENSQDIILTPRKGYRFWKIELQTLNGQPMPRQDAKHIIIKTRSGSKMYKFYLYKETELLAPAMY